MPAARRSRRRIGNALLTGALVFGAGTAAAANDGQAAFPARDAGNIAVTVELEDDVLHRFVDAAHDVQAIRREFAERMRRAARGERRHLWMRARDEVIAAIERQGLDVAEYEAIGDVLENDRDLGDRLEGGSGRGQRA